MENKGISREARLVAVVDDHCAVRRATADIIVELGYAAAQYGSGLDLLAAPVIGDIGCVLSDLRMPRMDGVELLTRLRALGYSVPFLLMTADIDVDTSTRAQRAGALAILRKPIDLSELDALLTSAFATSH